MALGVVSGEVRHGLFKQFAELSKFSLVQPTKEQAKSDKQKTKDKSVAVLMAGILGEYQQWDKAQVQAGGRILFSVGGKDGVTKAIDAQANFKKNPNAEVQVLKDAIHLTALIKPEEVIAQVEAELYPSHS